MNEYEVKVDTLAIIFHEKGVTQVIEKDGDFFTDIRPTIIIDNSCKYFGSSLSGRQEGTKKMIDVSHKAPIIVEESSNLIFFPTHSPIHPNCSWISIKNLVHYRKSSNDRKTIVVFSNGISLEFDVRYGSLNNQILRAARLGNVLRNRKERTKEKNKKFE